MNRTLLGVVVALVALTATADDVKLDAVPADVRATIEQQVGKLKIEDLQRQDRHGNIVFLVDYDGPGFEHLKLLVADDGTVIQEWEESF